MIEIKSLDKTYNLGKPNAFHALKSVDVSIKKGEIVAIMGKSGAGKSTLLHIIGTLDRHDNGSYIFLEKNIMDLSDKELSFLRAKEFGFVLQDFGLIMDENVLSNISAPLYFDDTKYKQIKEKALKALSVIGISELANKKVKHLSGGQKQRVAIARAIVNDPKLILADEPTGSLDNNTSEEIMDILIELNKKGKTIIIVTHNTDIANCCHRIINISDGKIID